MESPRRSAALSLALLLSTAATFLFLANGQVPKGAGGDLHAPGLCSMYGVCATRADGKFLNCPNRTRAVKPDVMLSSKIQSLCPTITGDICCTPQQFDILRDNVQQAVPLIVGCPACLRNFLNLFCELSCSPDQSLFINVTAVKQVNGTSSVDRIDYYVARQFGEQLYDSCKDVKFGALNNHVMDLIGASATNYTGFFAFLGTQAAENGVGSPYAINFPKSLDESSGMKPMNVTTYSCADSVLGCSCGDCPAKPLCSEGNTLPVIPESKTCSIGIGSLNVKCLEMSLAVVYLVLVTIFLVWGFLYRRKARTDLSSKTKSFLDANKSDKSENTISMETSEDVAPVSQVYRPSMVQDFMSNFFRKYGIFVSRRPILVLCCSLAVPLLLCLGLIHFQVETRPAKLWVGPGSKAAAEKQFFDTHLSPFYRIEQLIISTIPASENEKAPSIITDVNLKLLFEVQKKVDDLRANYSGTAVALTDICLKPLGSACASQTVLQYFQMNSTYYDQSVWVDHVQYCVEHFSSEKTCLSAFSSPIDPSTALGGYSGNNYSEASSFIITYPVNNEVDITGNENAKAVAWEKSFISLAKEEILPMITKQNLALSFSSESSIQEELKRESYADVITIAVSYLLMFAYISISLGDGGGISSFFISSKVLLAFSGIILVILSVVGSIGFYSAVGVKSTLIIMEVIPFLVLAVGVDNMCILVHAVKRQHLELSLEERISNALMEVGPSITLASLSEVLAFAVGTVTSMPACRVFSMFAALAVFFDFLLQVTAFVALIKFDFQRAESGRVDCIPCVRIPPNAGTNGSDRQNLGLLTRYMKEIHAPVLSRRGVKVVVMAVFIGCAFVSIALCTKIQPGLDQKIVLPRDSYLQKYFDDLAEYLRVGPPLYFVVKNFNYSLDSNQINQICSISGCNSDSFLTEITKASMVPKTSYIAKPAASWLDDYLAWMSPEAFGCCRKFVNGSYCPPDDQPGCCDTDGMCPTNAKCRDCTTCFFSSDLNGGRPSTSQFKEKLPWFLDALPSADCAKGGKAAYRTNIDLSGYESGIIPASAFRTYHTPLNKQTDYVNALRAARDFSSKMADSLKMEIFPYSVFYIFFEQYLDIWRTALINIAIGLGAVFLVSLVFTSSFWASTIILTVLAMIVIDIMGVMALLDIQLNAISVVNLVMSIGIAVEFCVHITHSFMVNAGDRETRTKNALSTMGASVFSGITLTKLIGVVVLRFAKSEVFVVYYFQMYLALVLIGFLHGLVFLQVLLSICGPPSRTMQIERKQLTT